MSRYVVYEPVVGTRAAGAILAPTLGDLAGRRIGLLFSTKADLDLVLHRMRERLATAYPGIAFEWVSKPCASAAMTPANFAVSRRSAAW